MERPSARPKLTDPEEMALIRQVYFAPPTVTNEELDPEERWERQSRRRTKNTSR